MRGSPDDKQILNNFENVANVHYQIFLFLIFFLCLFAKISKDEDSLLKKSLTSKEITSQFFSNEIKTKTKRRNPGSIMIKIVLNLLFTAVLFSACYINKDQSSFVFKNWIAEIFNDHQNVK